MFFFAKYCRGGLGWLVGWVSYPRLTVNSTRYIS